jgi:hypothetical protein
MWFSRISQVGGCEAAENLVQYSTLQLVKTEFWLGIDCSPETKLRIISFIHLIHPLMKKKEIDIRHGGITL